MTDRAIIGCALACWIGASLAIAIPLPLVALALAGLIVGVRMCSWRPSAVAVAAGLGLALLSTSLAARAWVELASTDAGPWTGIATLVSDPQPERGGVRVDLLVDGRRVQARTWGSPAGQLRARLLGERVEVRGVIRDLPAPSPWFAARRVSGTMAVDHVGSWSTGQPHYRLANAVRRTIESGAASLDWPQRSLLTGFVYGDDRFQDALTADSFRAAGLTHLLAVSGQNVAFVLVIGGPVLRRFDFRGRFLLTLLTLLVFATLTRFEPSVLRASLMAAVASLATVLGRGASSGRVLALAVLVLVVLHPLIVHALAFQLSVAASLGILVIGPRLAELIPGPRVLREAIAVTGGAQLAVAPLLVTVFGGLPVASLPANIAAGPAAGPVMMWGLTAGVVAGMVQATMPTVATVIHLPTRVLIGWVQGIAELAAVLPFGELRLWHVIGLAGAILTVRLARSSGGRRVAAMAIVLVLVSPAIELQLRPPASFHVDDGTTVWRDSTVTIMQLDASTGVEDLLGSLRQHGVRRVDLIVTPGTRASFTQLVTIEQRLSVGAIWAPMDHRVPGAVTPDEATALRVGELKLVLVDDATGYRLEPVAVADQPTVTDGPSA